MDETQARELVIKKSRRDVLTTLKMFYPGPADFYSIRLVLPEVETRHLRIDVSYLIDKKYVMRTDKVANQPWDKREFRLTAEGVETADWINKDPALNGQG